jgi:hypothetical protein
VRRYHSALPELFAAVTAYRYNVLLWCKSGFTTHNSETLYPPELCES